VSENFRYTEEVLDRAAFLKQTKRLSWAVIAERLGCPAGSLRTTVSDRKKGKWVGQNDQRSLQRELLEQLVLQGATPPQMREAYQRMFGITLKPSALSMRLRNMGYDREVRNELVREVRVH
jgi:hypothetical protein